MKLSLIGGREYKFQCTIVLEGLEKLIIQQSGFRYKCLGYPFLMEDYSWRKTEFNLENLNKFIVSSEDYLMTLDSGKSSVEDPEKKGNSKDIYYPALDRYYGELEGFIPADGATAVIQLKRVAFGFKLKVKGHLTGTLKWNSFRDGIIDLTDFDGSTGYENTVIYTFPYIKEGWVDDTYSIDTTFKFTWSRPKIADGIFEKTVSLKRNVMTVLTVNLIDSSKDYPISFEVEQEEFQPGEKYIVDYN